MNEWVLGQYLQTLEQFGLDKPWYWDLFLDSLDSYHHMVYASAYTYRATVWFDLVVPGPQERTWLRRKYPRYWSQFEAVWEQVDARWRQTDVGNDWGVHGTVMVGLCNLCQLVLSGDSMLVLARKLVQSARPRVAYVAETALSVLWQGSSIEPARTVASLNPRPLDRFDVVRRAV